MRLRSELTVMPPFIFGLFCIFAFTSCVLAASNSSCYYPSGLEYRGTPCKADALVSPCCGPGFICLSNGLCRPGPAIEADYRAEYYRSGCTDSSFNSTDCPRVCIGSNDKLDGGETLQSCGQNRYCCTTNGDCCTDDSAVFELGTADIVTTITVRGSTSTSTSQPIGSSTATPTPSSPDDGGDDSNAVAIGVGVGVGVGSFLAIMLAVFLFLRHRRNNRNIPKAGATELDGLEGSRAISESEAATKYTYNKSNSELEGDSTARIPKNPQELDPVPIYEIGSSTQPAEGEKNTGKNEDESSGQYFKQDGTYRHEAP